MTATVPSAPQARTVSDAIRRGADSAIANWPLLLIRIGESILMGALMIGLVIAIVVPLAVSLGLSHLDLKNPDDAAALLAGILIEHWLVLVWVLVAVSVALGVWIAIHSFVVGGVARVLVNADRAAGEGAGPRERFAAFSMDSWFAGARETWWPIFWIYNIAYGIAGLVVMLPILPLALLVIVTKANPVALVVSCLGLVLIVFMTVLVMIVTGIVCQKAIVLTAKRPYDAVTALRLAWRAMRTDFGRHFGVAIIMIVITFALGGIFAGASFMFALPGAAAGPMAGLVFMPVRLGLSFVNGIFSAAISNWFIASFAAITGETS